MFNDKYLENDKIEKETFQNKNCGDKVADSKNDISY